MRVAFHPRAVEDAARIDAWWKENRQAAPELFVRELEQFIALIAASPTLGSPAESEDELPGVRRALMQRTRYYVYYRVQGETLEVLAVWHSARGAGPTLG
jgi:toxin ParE1/3/4